MAYRERLPGGLAAGRSPEEFDTRSLREGTRVELEHTSDRGIAREIAMDHLTEDPDYYNKLRLIEDPDFYTKLRGAALGNPPDTDTWLLISIASSVASAYHGYKRNNSLGWAAWWGLVGYVFPVVTPVVALAQGYGRPEKP